MQKLLAEIKKCTACKSFLPFEPRPVMQASIASKIVIIGQAPGIKVQNSGVPWDDLSGKELRRWLGVSITEFYNTKNFTLMPMGFCYPGKGTNGDLPPRSECAPLWHKKVLDKMPNVKLIILIGQYAQQYYLNETKANTLTETVKNYVNYLPNYFPLVHPSPRNKIWQKKNPWFEIEVLPTLQNFVAKILFA